jgi:hypothetical protein
MKKCLPILGLFALMVLICGCTTTAYKDTRYKPVLTRSAEIQKIVDDLIGEKTQDIISTLGEPTETTKWGDDEGRILFVYKVDEKSKLSIYMGSGRVLKALLTISSN